MLQSVTRKMNLVIMLMLLISYPFMAFAASGDEKRTLKTYGSDYFTKTTVKGLSTAKVFGTNKGTTVKLKDPVDNSNIESFAGTFNGEVDGSTANFYCVDLQHPLAKWTAAQPHTYTDSGHTISAITYILNNYYPFKSYPYTNSASSLEKEAASVQLAIWHFSDGVDANTISHNTASIGLEIKNRVLAIIADANANSGTTVPVPTLVFVPSAQTNHITAPASFIVKAVDQNNNPLSGISITLTATSGTLSAAKLTTNSNGETPSFTLTKGNALSASVTAVANVIIPQGTKYVHTCQPDHYQKVVLATPASAMKSAEGTCTWIEYKPVTPLLECVTKNSNGTYTANFGYYNENSFDVTIAAGNLNKFSPEPANRGQVTVFKPGRSGYFPDAAYQVTFDGNAIEWSLTGPDGVTRKVTASASSASCAEHIYFNKKWINDKGDTLTGVPSGLPSNYKITATSSLGSATGSYVNGTLKFVYSNKNGETNGLLVDINGNYTVAEENLPANYAAIAGVGSFVSEFPGGYAVNPYKGSENSALHNIINKETLPKFGSIGDRVWIDENKDGIQNAGEKGLRYVTVDLYTCDNKKIEWTLTDADGKYLFDSLQAGSYYVKFHLIDKNAKYIFTTQDAGNDTLDSDVSPLTGMTVCTELSAGENDLTWDAGVYEKPVELGSIGDKVWLDVNKNGIQDQGEAGVQNITVQLYSCADVLLSATVTNANGLYLFDSLNAGSYYVKFSLPGGYEFSPANAVTDDAKDSDADITTGRTTCFTLDQGEDDLTWDAGISEIVIPENGSIGDKVWLDGDKDGQQDDSEAGVSNVTVKLYNCDNTLLSTTLTNNAGNYLFTELPAGSYYVMFVLPEGYTFTSKDGITDDEEDSDADQATGRTVCFTLAEGQDDLSRDAGLQVVTAPELWLTKDDNRTVMPKTNEQNTYTIKYGNKGGSAIYKAYIEDILPEGTSYVSCSGGSSCAETWAGSKVVKWQIGTIEPGQSGQVTITVKVDTFKAQYVNSACINGQDTYKNPFQACDDDVNIADSCSGGHEGGVESRGEMAELLLLRKLKIQYGMTTPIVAKSKGNVSLAKASLNTLLPESGPYNSVPVETTPFDILGISNAVASYAADYMAATEEGQKRVATIFSTITEAPYIYDHSKQGCDRLAGSEIQDLSLSVISGHKFYTAKMLNTDGLTDYAISFSIYETANGYAVENKWTHDEYNVPSGATNVYNFQVWSSTIDGTEQMVKNVIAKFKAMGQVSYMNNSQAVPNIYISKAKYTHDGNIIMIVNNNYSPISANLSVRYRESQGSNQLESTKSYNIPSGTSEIKFPAGIIADAQVHLTQSAVEFKDEVYISGGAYTYITGEKSTVSTFNTSSYTKQDMANYPSGSLVLAGGAAVSGELKDYVSVVRSLTAGATAYDLSKYGTLRFDARGKGKVSVIIDLTTLQGYNYFTYELDMSDNMQTYSIPFSSFTQKYGTKVDFDASKIKNIGFVYTTTYNSSLTSFNFEVTNIAFTPSGTTGVEETETTVPSEFSLEQNYPNPFNPSTMINFDVPKKEMLTLKVYNVIGQEVAVLVNGELEAGKHSVKFDAANLSSGVYFYKLNGSSVNLTRKMILTK